MKTNPHVNPGGSRPNCHPQDLILVNEGVQCGNCLALVIDRRTPEPDDQRTPEPDDQKPETKPAH